MKMWPVDITKQCKSEHCIAWEHISPNVQKECHLIPVILVSEWQSKVNCCATLNHQGIELYTELYIVSGREFKRRQRSILSRRGNTLDENQLVWDCLLPRWHWQQNPFISQIGISSWAGGVLHSAWGVSIIDFYFIFSFKKIWPYDSKIKRFCKKRAIA